MKGGKKSLMILKNMGRMKRDELKEDIHSDKGVSNN